MVVRRIALAGADRRALASEVAATLRRGELCVLPTETVYGLALLPSAPQAMARAHAFKGRAAGHEFTLHLADAAAARLLAPTADPRASRLMARYWPGPMTLVLPGRDGKNVGLRVPAHAFTREVIAAVGEPLWLTSVNRTGEPPLTSAAAIAAAFGDQLALLVDDGASALGTASTVVRCTGDALELLREGILLRDEVLRTAAALVLFVCTGNTCRSPLAEVLGRHELAHHLQIADDAVLAHGVCFASAGTGTLDGMPASDGSRAVALEQGLDLDGHRSTALSVAQCQRAARIYCLSAGHRDAVLELLPEASERTELLRPDGGSIADPFGGNLTAYRRARDEIQRAIAGRRAQFAALLPP